MYDISLNHYIFIKNKISWVSQLPIPPTFAAAKKACSPAFQPQKNQLLLADLINSIHFLFKVLNYNNLIPEISNQSRSNLLSHGDQLCIFSLFVHVMRITCPPFSCIIRLKNGFTRQHYNDRMRY